jgi:primosomal protein N' (replication factor Y)
MPRYADIALPVSVDKTFTYLIPPELEASALVGTRAIVPFGRTRTTGLIVSLPATTSITSLKSIQDIVDAQPVVSGELLRLCVWIADYYMAPLGEVLRTAMPHGFSTSSKRLARLVRLPPSEELSRLERQAPKRAKVLSILSQSGEALASDLQRKSGLKTINAVLNDLVREGWIATEEVLPQLRGKPALKEFAWIHAVDQATLAAELDSLPLRKKRARRLLETVQRMHNEGLRDISVIELLKKSSASSALFRPYADSGLIPTDWREIHPQQDLGTDDATLAHVLNPDQQAVLQAVTTAVDSGLHKTFLLHGITGSGKTQVYIEAIRHCLEQGKSAIVLVPEISLTPQIVRRFRSHFGDLAAVVHSRMAAGERLAVWRRALTGNCRIVIGPRSAVFAPLSNTGLIVVDEEHEASYKQFDSMPRYNARDVAIVRGSYEGAVILLGSATPSTESAYNAQQGKYELLSMLRRIDEVPLPPIALIDMTAERKREYATLKESLPEERRHELKQFRQSAISGLLQEKIRDRLTRHEGIILLQNRRGFAPFVECPDCGFTEMCDNCSVTMTYHLTQKHLRCHYCGTIRHPRNECPDCHGMNLQLIGVGTQRVEQDLAKLFPEARVLRMDLDTTSRKGSHDRILRTFGEGRADILLGTQMVAKGLDFPRVTLVGVISADTQMLLPDFRASERTFQLLTQVSGRAGRSTLQGEVLIQTHQPDHPALRHVTGHDYWGFYEEELDGRKELNYPPLSRLVLIEFRGKNENTVKSCAVQFASLVQSQNGTLQMLGPSPAVIGKIKQDYRWHILLKSSKSQDPAAAHLRRALVESTRRFEQTRKGDVRVIIDVDPVGTL